MTDRGESPPAPAGRSGLALQPRMSPAAAEALADALKALRGSDLAVDATAVAFIATPCLQVLLAAARTWRSDGRTLVLAPSDALRACLDDLGLDPAALESEVAPCP